MQINLSSCRTSDHYFSLPLQQLSLGLLGTKNVSSFASTKFFEGTKIMAAEKIMVVEITLSKDKLAHWIGSRKIQWNTMIVCM